MSNKKLFGISFLVNFTFSMLTTLLSLIVYDINQKSSDITFVKGAFICSLILVRALQFKNSFPPLTNICVGSALFTLGCFILTIQYHNFIWMILGAMLFGVAIGLVPPAILTMISDNENPDLNLGIYNSIVAISSIFSPLVGETIYKINPQSIFIGWFISSLLMTIVAFTISPKSIQVKESRNETNKQSISSVLNKEFLMMFFVLFFTSISYGSIVSYLPIYFKDIGGSIGIYYLFFWSGYIIVLVLKSVNYSRKMILMAICFCVLGQTCLILFNFTLFLYLTALFYGIGYGTLFKVFYSRIGRFKSEISRNIGFSVIGLISYLGVGFAPVFLLPLNTGTWKLLFIGSTTYSIIALFIFYIMEIFLSERKINEVETLLPQKFPFQFIDSIEKLDLKNKSIICSYSFRKENPIFKGHFPNNPIVPGVLLIESIAQSSILLMLKLNNSNNIGGDCFLSKVEDLKFTEILRPEEIFTVNTKYERSLSKFHFFSSKVYNNEDVKILEGKFIVYLNNDHDR
ncbi:MFS transporter [Streptococcus agalactiae]|uniref:MFS transporter n=1 Tax=Streptococcus agalactiae TaxID=1311 RepID=UPI0002BB0DEA|nr:MFS transporter [Streptococcus agalactiae]EPU27057.1 hypothetical protein SAG0139_06280 [Streptococcus agalactiae MRI Z1-012]EPU63843.1 hypothetical protein SAG0306_01645 [Streptococcus agalactiae GB00082]EPW27881.1 hypothetical protein SAG0054_10340 [Streptococcus agalactiae CCUG 28551]MCH9591157.1 MFS transporter [Streptococcus agalactiae]MCH9599429.1 MFS transporter [Streptococcus agalactiae]